jgi:hypothetical protein
VQELSWSLLLARAAGGAGGRAGGRAVLPPDRGVGARPARPLQPLAQRHPLRFAAGCGLAVAVIGIVTGGATAGAGYAPTRAMLEGQGELPGSTPC